uniref:ShKT domain-containing protein n=1 Tax=Parastrongyloides trichosuri TaxID=131310 RepID=A0A0N4Z1N9_PARTI
MFSSKICGIISIYLIVSPKYEAADTQVCNAAADCVGGLECVTVGAENICVAPCTVANEETECGGAGTCVQVQNIANQNVYSCATNRGCLTDNECSTADPSRPICNLYNLQCIEDVNAQVTATTAPATTTGLADLIVGGLFDCAHHIQYCFNIEWIALMREKCPVTCGFASITGLTGVTVCRDLLPDCSRRPSICQNTAYRDFVRTNCRYTCGLC